MTALCPAMGQQRTSLDKHGSQREHAKPSGTGSRSKTQKRHQQHVESKVHSHHALVRLRKIKLRGRDDRAIAPDRSNLVRVRLTVSIVRPR